VIVAVLAGGLLLAPALATLFRLALGGTFGHPGGAPAATAPASAQAVVAVRPALLLRMAGALLVAGIGLVNVAGGTGLHIAGAACFLAFVVVAFRAALPLDAEP
jgi:hypothetical protein